MLLGLQGVSEQVGTVGYWAFIALFAVRVGFSGACSTVSTFVAEVSALFCAELLQTVLFSVQLSSFRGAVPAVQIKGQLQLLPEVLHGYGYAAGSLAAGALLGVLVYGSMVWTA